MVKRNTIIENMNILMNQNIDSGVLGNSIIYEIFLNRVRQARTYDRGMIRRFQNFEKNALERGLENLVIDKEMDFEWTRNMRELYDMKHSLNRLNFIYDGIMFLTQKRKTEEEIQRYLGEKAKNTLTKIPQSGKTHYFAFLNNIKSDIADSYNIIFD